MAFWRINGRSVKYVYNILRIYGCRIVEYMYYIILLYHEFLINFAEFGQIGEGFHNSPRYNAHFRCVSK